MEGLSRCVLKGMRIQQSNINTMTPSIFVILFLYKCRVLIILDKKEFFSRNDSCLLGKLGDDFNKGKKKKEGVK